MRSIIALVLTLALVAPALAATPFADVPKTHWAYDAISQAVDAGILQGYDGKFHGQRLLNRYQMAVIVAKLLDNVKPGAPMAGKADAKTLSNIEALTTEFADELALLNTKVTTLEGTTQELKKDLEAMKGHGDGATGAGLGFTAFAQVGLISTDKGSSVPYAGPTAGTSFTRYTNQSPDSLFFTLPQASIGVDKEVNPGVYFHAQFDYMADVNDDEDGYVGINEAYFFVDEMLGDIGGKVGAFAGPFSMEHNGPFRTCNYTITPSIVNSVNEAWRGYGVEFQRTKDVKPSDIMWKVGIVSGTDSGTYKADGLWSDRQNPMNWAQGERDDGFGYYLWIGKKPEKKGFGWNIGYFDNGGDNTPSIGHSYSEEISAWQVGFEWWGDKFGVMGQYMDASVDTAPGSSHDGTAWYLLVNFEINEKNNVTLRYDDGTLKDFGGVGFDFEVTGITFAFNHKVTENSLFQFEYLTPDDNTSGVATWQDTKDDLVQLRYKVHF